MRGIFFFLFFYAVSSQANQNNLVFKSFIEKLERGDRKGALYHLRNRSLEMTGTDKFLSHYAQAVLSMEEKQWDEALAQLRQARPLRALKDYSALMKAQIYKHKGKAQKALSFIKQIENSQNQTPYLLNETQFEKAQILIQKKRYKKAQKSLVPLVKEWRRSKKRAEVLHLLMSYGEKKGSKKYCHWYKTLYSSHPDSAYSRSFNFLPEIQAQEKSPAYFCSLDYEDKKRRLYTSFRMGMVNKVQKDLAQLSDSKLKNKLFSDFYYLTGQMQKSLNILESKKGLFSEEERLKKASRLNYYMGHASEAVLEYKKLGELDYKNKDSYYYYLGKLLLNTGQYPLAHVYLQQAVNQAKTNRFKSKVMWLKAWSLYLSSSYEEAYADLKELTQNKKYRRYLDQEKLYYWIARSLEKSGSQKESIQWYKKVLTKASGGYYPLLSALRLESRAQKERVYLSYSDFLPTPWKRKAEPLLSKRESFFESFKLSARAPSSLLVGRGLEGEILGDLAKPSIPLAYDFEKTKEDKKFASSFDRAKYFSRIGFFGRAREELAYIEKKSKSESTKKRAFNFFRSVRDFEALARSTLRYFLSNRLSSDEKEARFYWEASYPKAYEDKVVRASEQSQLSSALIWAHMRAESFYNRRALSPVGAKGLMQIMPYTAFKIMELKSKAHEFANVEALSSKLDGVELNISLGAYYLKRLEKVFSSRLPLMAASYNAGPHRAKLWAFYHPKLEMDEFIEGIPFKETKSYTKKIVYYHYLYSSLYESKTLDYDYLIKGHAYDVQEPPATQENWSSL